MFWFFFKGFLLGTLPLASEKPYFIQLSKLNGWFTHSNYDKRQSKTYTWISVLTSRTCLTTASEAPNKSTPEMPRTSVSTAPGDRFFFLRPGTNIQGIACMEGAVFMLQRAQPQSRGGIKNRLINKIQFFKKILWFIIRGEATEGDYIKRTLLDYWTHTG